MARNDADGVTDSGAGRKSRAAILHRPFGNDGFEHQLVRRFERGFDLAVEPVRMTVERVERAENVDRGVGIAHHEHGGIGFVGCLRERRRIRRGGGHRGSNQKSDHPTASFAVARLEIFDR